MMTTIHRTLILTALMLLVALPFPAEAREFINNFMSINLGVGYGLPGGGIVKSEEKIPFIVSSLPYAQVSHPSHYTVSYSISVDVLPLPPFVLGDESHALKLGVRAGYRFDTMRQRIVLNRPGQSTWRVSGDLSRSQYWTLGPAIRYAPFIKYDPITGQYGSRWGFVFFATGGTITYGRLESRAARLSYIGKGAIYSYYTSGFSAGQSFVLQEAQGMFLFRSAYKGYRIDAGIGVECAIFFINAGINCYYSRVGMDLEQPVMGKYSEHYDQLTFEGYLSIPIEWSFLPRTF